VPELLGDVGNGHPATEHQARVGGASVVDADVTYLRFLKERAPHSITEPRIFQRLGEVGRRRKPWASVPELADPPP